MINMDYCRFNNTDIALEECLESIKNGDKLSEREMNSCRSMFEKFIEFCFDAGILDGDTGYENIHENLEEFYKTIGDRDYWN